MEILIVIISRTPEQKQPNFIDDKSEKYPASNWLLTIHRKFVDPQMYTERSKARFFYSFLLQLGP